MAANILQNSRAVRMSIFVVRAFIKMRQTMAANNVLVEKLRELESRFTQRLDTHEKAVVYVLAELRRLMEPPNRSGGPLDLAVKINDVFSPSRWLQLTPTKLDTRSFVAKAVPLGKAFRTVRQATTGWEGESLQEQKNSGLIK
jgi:hypothetical protein